jgi:hypothetical protein
MIQVTSSSVLQNGLFSDLHDTPYQIGDQGHVGQVVPGIVDILVIER